MNANFDPRQNQKKKEPEDLVNERIPFPQVRVIGPDGSALGIMPKSKAIQLASTYNLDLFCVNKDGNPPVCKIIDYGKYRFDQQKKKKEMLRNQRMKEIEIKEVQLTPVIGQHDLEVKAKRANEFLVRGDKIKVALRFKGRQMAHVEIGEEVMKKFIELCQENCNIEKEPKLDGKLLTAILASKYKK